MISSVFHSIIYQPLYNGLVFFIEIVPGHDVGLAIILLTAVVRIILYPLSKRAIESQKALKKIVPEVEEVKKKHPANSPEQTQAVFALYRERGVHPFAGVGLLLIQLPVLIGLYWVFARGGLPQIDASQLYAFVHVPASVNMLFLGLLDIGMHHDVVLAILTALTQFAYTRLSMGRPATRDPSPVESTLSGDMAKSFDTQARYVLPAFIGIIAFSLSSAVALYFVTSNTFMILQELAAGRRFRD